MKPANNKPTTSTTKSRSEEGFTRIWQGGAASYLSETGFDVQRFQFL